MDVRLDGDGVIPLLQVVDGAEQAERWVGGGGADHQGYSAVGRRRTTLEIKVKNVVYGITIT